MQLCYCNIRGYIIYSPSLRCSITPSKRWWLALVVVPSQQTKNENPNVMAKIDSLLLTQNEKHSSNNSIKLIIT